MTQSYPKAANVLGSLALAVADRIREATEQPDDGLAASAPAALVTLAHYPGRSVHSLARTLGLTHSGAVRLADRLAADGLVRRTPAGQGRTLALRLTDAGTQAAQRVLARLREAVEQLVSVLDAGEADLLRRLASRLLTELTTDRASAFRLCRLCDEPLCMRDEGCPVNRAIVA